MRVKEKKKNKPIKKLIVVALFLLCVGIIINIAPNYIIENPQNKTNIIINNNNVTKSLKNKLTVSDKGVVFLSFEDIENFFDGEIYYDKQYDQIITTSATKVANIKENTKEMYVNGSKMSLYETMYKEDGVYYIPFSEMKNIYNVNVSYSKESNIVTIDSLNKEQKNGNSSKNANVKYKPTTFSKTIDKVKKGESVIVIEQIKGWYKIRTSKGNIGYIKDVANIYNSRENIEDKKQIDGKVSLVWDYFSANAPVRTGTTISGVNVVSPSFIYLKDTEDVEVATKIGLNGQAYIKWAHDNGYKVWSMVQSDELKRSTKSAILNDYKLREKLIDKILNIANEYELDGINIDFEFMYESDKDAFSRFIIELAPRLKEVGKVLSVDVTAPDGSPEWSMCYDRNKIAKAADYIIFMAYDQNGISSPKEGTTAGADWVEVNIKKFLGQEGVKEDKLILAMPFYTRLWKENNGNINSSVVYMKSIDKNIPSGVEKIWDNDLKQYYVEYKTGDTTYKMWIEDERSFKEKFKLMKDYKLAGAAYWQKDFEPETIWNVIAEELN